MVAPLWVLTHGAVAAGTNEKLTSLAQAPIWGLGRVAGLEHPERWGGLIDLPLMPDERAASRLCAVLADGREDQIAIRLPGILVRRLVRAPRPSERQPWRPDGTVLITGGTGALGGHVARWLAGRAMPRMVLTSRSGPAATGAAVLAAELAEAGTGVAIIGCDLADRAQAAALLTKIEAAQPPLTAIFHAAGAGQATPLAQTSVPEMTAVLAAKATAAAYLDELTAGLDLDQFVLFSSIAATWGSACSRPTRPLTRTWTR